MTGLSARTSSASEPCLSLARGEISIWLSEGPVSVDSGTFLRDLLSRYSGMDPSEMEFTRGEHGKPYLVNTSHSLQFSLSHSGDRLVLAVGGDVPVGVDLEAHNPKRQVMSLARRFFSRAEQDDLDALPDEARLQHFYDLWTLKEARVKALGGSLALELDATGFRIDHAAPGEAAISQQPDSRDAFYGLLFEPPGYSLAICALVPPEDLPRIKLFTGSAPGEALSRPVHLRARSSIKHR